MNESDSAFGDHGANGDQTSSRVKQRTAEVRELGRTLGFDKVAIADASHALDVEFQRYEAFVDAGMHGEMSYLAANRDVRRRLDSPAILEGARSVICIAERYAPNHALAGRDDSSAVSDAAHAGEPGRPDEEMAAEPGCVLPNVARYARGRDYHDHLRKRLRAFAAAIRSIAPGALARPMTDTAPVLERAWAARSGLGFIGKNGLLIVPGSGSFVLLGEVVTTLALEPDPPIAERCGSCRLCLDACPTGAFERAFVLDARRCVAYLTIELRGAMPESLRSGVGQHWFGCDTCQEVCPHNRAPRPPARSEYRALAAWQLLSLEALASMDDQRLAEIVRGTPLRRARRAGLVRNAITVLGNRRKPSLRPLYEHLAAGDPEPSVREHARWALVQLDRANQP